MCGLCLCLFGAASVVRWLKPAACSEHVWQAQLKVLTAS